METPNNISVWVVWRRVQARPPQTKAWNWSPWKPVRSELSRVAALKLSARLISMSTASLIIEAVYTRGDVPAPKSNCENSEEEYE